DEVIAFVETDRNDTFAQWSAESFERRLFNGAERGAHEDEFVRREFLDRQYHVDFFAVLQREHIDDRPAARVARTLRHFVHLDPIDTAAIREAQDVIVRVCNE